MKFMKVKAAVAALLAFASNAADAAYENEYAVQAPSKPEKQKPAPVGNGTNAVNTSFVRHPSNRKQRRERNKRK